jgi:hypothetical protein
MLFPTPTCTTLIQHISSQICLFAFSPKKGVEWREGVLGKGERAKGKRLLKIRKGLGKL